LSPAAREFIQVSLALRAESQRAEEERRERELAQAQALAQAEHQRAETEARARRFLRWLAAAATVMFLLAAVGGPLARSEQLRAQRAAQVSQSLNLVTSAHLALAEANTDLALTLALEANRIPDPPLPAEVILADAAYAPGTRRIFRGHDGPVEDLAIAPDGRTVLSASADGTLILWDIWTEPVLSTSSGQVLSGVEGRHAGIAATLNAGQGSAEMIRRFSGHRDTVRAIAFLPGGDRALSASADGTLILWDIESGDILRRFTGHGDGVWDVAVSPDGRTALSGAADHTLILWDIQTGEVIRRFTGHEDAVLSVALSPDGAAALSGSADRSVALWDLWSGEIRHRMSGVADTVIGAQQAIGHYDSVWDVAFLPDGHSALSVSQDGHAILWDLDAGQLLRRFDAETGLFSLAVGPDGSAALLGALDSRVLLLDLAIGEFSLQLRGHEGRALAVAFVNSLQTGWDERAALSGSADGTVRLWDLCNGAEMRRLEYADPPDPAAAAVAVSPDGRLGLTGLWTGEISLWDYASGEEIRRLRGHSEMVFGGVHFLPDGRRAVSAAGDISAAATDNTVRLWDVEAGQELSRLEGHTDKIWDIDVTADGRFVASGSHDGTLRLWDISTALDAGIAGGAGRVLLDVSPQAVRSVAFSPDGGSLVVGLAKGQASNPDYSLRLLETDTGGEIGRLVGHRENVADVAFSPDGKRILSSSSDSSVILWDAASGAEIHRLIGHASGVMAVAFHPAGRLALSGAADGSLLLWDVEQGVALRRYAGLTKPVVGLAFVPDGGSFLVAAHTDAVHEWRIDATQDELLAWVAANRHVPELTCGQRKQYGIEPLCEEAGAEPRR
jgi:WD40 repeat protein